ncbi:MAG: hypothetical protein ACTTI3_02465 [Treponema sp.]
MTIAGRNKFLILGIIITSALCIVGTGSIVFLIRHNMLHNIATPHKPLYECFPQWHLLTYNRLAVITGTLAFPVIAAILLIYMYLIFEKTHAFEISFFSLFIFGIAFEALKLLFPLFNAHAALSTWTLFIARAILFARFFAFLSLFVASLFAYKTFTQETLAIIFLLCFISFSLIHIVPINIVITSSFASFSHYYTALLYWFNGIICLLSIISFLLTGILRNIAEYKKAGLSLITLFFAYTLLLYCGSWPCIAAGIALFFFGGFSFVRTIHRFYLWQ